MAEKKEEEGAADWSNLPYDLVEEILDQLANYTLDISDYARCAAVCVSWRQVYKDHEPLISPQLPVLMIPSNTLSSNNNKDDSDDHFCSFYRITDGKVYDQLKVRMPSYRHCRGSSYGWLVTVDDDVDKGFPVRLINPFLSSSENNNIEISLPSLKHLPVVYDSDHDDYGTDHTDGPCNYRYLHKAILSADPISVPADYIVMAIYGGERFKRLAYWRPGDKVWVPTGPSRIKFEDVILKSRINEYFNYHKDEFHAVTSCGSKLYSFKFADILDENVADVFANTQKQYMCQFSYRDVLPPVPNKKLYLVPILNRKTYLLVLRVIDIGHDEGEATKTRPYSTKEFKVFMSHDSLKEKDYGGRTSFAWKEINTLGGHTLFIGDNASISIHATNCPPAGCKPDCIYYTDDCYLGYVEDLTGNIGAHDMGLFNVKDNSFEKHYPTDNNNPIRPIPTWVEPSIQKTGGVFRE